MSSIFDKNIFASLDTCRELLCPDHLSNLFQPHVVKYRRKTLPNIDCYLKPHLKPPATSNPAFDLALWRILSIAPELISDSVKTLLTRATHLTKFAEWIITNNLIGTTYVQLPDPMGRSHSSGVPFPKLEELNDPTIKWSHTLLLSFGISLVHGEFESFKNYVNTVRDMLEWNGKLTVSDKLIQKLNKKLDRYYSNHAPHQADPVTLRHLETAGLKGASRHVADVWLRGGQRFSSLSSLIHDSILSLGDGWLKAGAHVKWSDQQESVIYLHVDGLDELKALRFVNPRWLNGAIIHPLKLINPQLSSHGFRRSLAVNIRRRLEGLGLPLRGIIMKRMNVLFNWSKRSRMSLKYSSDWWKWSSEAMVHQFPEINSTMQYLLSGLKPVLNRGVPIITAGDFAIRQRLERQTKRKEWKRIIGTSRLIVA